MAESRLCHTAWSELCHKQVAIMKHIAILILTLFASNLFSEELSAMSQEEMETILYSTSRANIPSLVRNSEVAGVGEFVNVPSPTNRIVDIAVQQWWTPNPGTNEMLRIHYIDESETNWIFPTNMPVVFFASAASNVVINTCLGADMLKHMSQEERERWMFKFVDRSWFRVSRDNGLVYDFTTNLWQHTRVNRNFTNQYEVIRDAYISAHNDILLENTLPSWRVAYDSMEGLSYIERAATESFLVEIMIDPLLPESAQDDIANALFHRFNWDVDTNGVLRAPDTAAMFLTSSNFTAQALAVWRTHDTNNIISFAQNAIATNAIIEALLFRGTAAYYLENDFITATNFIFSANQMLNENSIYTPTQKRALSGVINFFSAFDENFGFLILKVLGRKSYIGDRFLEDFWNEHSSEGGIFEKFGGEFPFSEALKALYNRE